MKTILSTVVLCTLFHHASAQVKSDTLKRFEYTDTSFEVGEVMKLRIFFDIDQADMRPESRTELNSLLEFLKSHDQLCIEIDNHTGAKGTSDFNMGLSERRAKSICDSLISHGILKDRLSWRGFGESSPIYTRFDSDELVLRAVSRTEIKITCLSNK
ncbi:MAG TPA: OmpA family protein [Chitinophagales bacterium]|nr:OmpA family protein [Chitinophagales bacterium]